MEYDGISEFWKAAPKRLADAEELLEVPTKDSRRSDAAYRHLCGAQYLAGYAVGFMLKAYIIYHTNVRSAEHVQTWTTVLGVRGRRGDRPDLGGSRSHDLELLLTATDLSDIMASYPDLKAAWGVCCKWRSYLRYNPRPVTDRGRTEEMVRACRVVSDWVRSQLPVPQTEGS